jgi:hypothetical protein
MSKLKTAGDQIDDLVNDGRDVAADTLGTLGEVVEYHASIAGDTVRQLGRKASTKIDSAADYMRDAEADEMADDASRVARSIAMPIAIAAGVIAVACLAAYLVRRS